MEENNSIFQEQVDEAAPSDGKKPLDTASLVLGIVAVVAAAFVPLVSYACGIIGLVFAVKRRREKRTTAALVLCIVGLVAAVVSNVVAAKIIYDALNQSM